MAQNGTFAPSSYDAEPIELPPTYSARPEPGSSSLPTGSTTQPTKIQEALWAFQDRLQEAVLQNHQDRVNYGTEQEREVRRQLFNLMSGFLGKVSKDSPRSLQDLPASVHGTLKADLYVAPQEAVPLSSGWHLSGVSQRDDEIIGRAVQEGRVWPTETPKSTTNKQKDNDSPEANGSRESQSRPDQDAGLWSAIAGLALDDAVYETQGTLWWNDERAAQELARTLDLWLVLLWRSSMLPGNDHVQVKISAEYMTFRRENEMGLWESKSGWTIAMAVTLLY
ncbi:hypothetical protein N0V82_007157 [Gnomoniopsis sp. IMI 355080]|nr:hypothetical protein N0V82_007157 [Gnomoniopsis sp. IMI 355080]